METPSWNWLVTGFQTVLLLWAWLALVALHVIWRISAGGVADEIRESGPMA